MSHNRHANIQFILLILKILNMGPTKLYDELMSCLNFYDFKYTKNIC